MTGWKAARATTCKGGDTLLGAPGQDTLIGANGRDQIADWSHGYRNGWKNGRHPHSWLRRFLLDLARDDEDPNLTIQVTIPSNGHSHHLPGGTNGNGHVARSLRSPRRRRRAASSFPAIRGRLPVLCPPVAQFMHFPSQLGRTA